MTLPYRPPSPTTAVQHGEPTDPAAAAAGFLPTGEMVAGSRERCGCSIAGVVAVSGRSMTPRRFGAARRSRQVAKTDRMASPDGGATRAGRGPADEHRADASRPASARSGSGAELGFGRRRTEYGGASRASCRCVTRLASRSARWRAVSLGGGRGAASAGSRRRASSWTVHRPAQPRPRAQAATPARRVPARLVAPAVR